MREEIKDLVGSLKTSLQDFAGGHLPFDEAKIQYKKLLSKYNTIQNGIGSDREDHLLRGICYHHNIENFSLFSGLYRLTPHQVNSRFYYGESYFDKRISGSRKTILDSVLSSPTSIIPAGRINGLPHDLHLQTVMDSGNGVMVFIAVSSSPYFSERKFTQAGNALGDIIGKILPDAQPFQFNYYSHIKHELEQQISRDLDGDYTIDVHFFVCNMIEKIFLHMGLKTLLEISGDIDGKLREKFGPDSKAFTLSLGEYIVLVKTKKETSRDVDKKRVELIYKTITIPYQTLKLQVNSLEELYEFWQSIFSFAHYIHFGDIQK